jgi:hypothetical protein
MMKPRVRDAGKVALGRSFVIDRRRAFEVPARTDKRARRPFAQNGMERRHGQQESDGPTLRRDVRRQGIVGSPANDDDGSRRIAKQSAFVIVQPCLPLGILDRTDHDGQRLCRSPFSLSESANGLGARRVDEQMVTAESFYGDDFSFAKRRNGGRNRLAGTDLPPGRVHESDLRSAARAGVRLRVKSTIRRVFVFAIAGGARRE